MVIHANTIYYSNTLTKVFTIISTILLSSSLLAGLILTSSTSYADVVDDVSITVPVACGINDTLNTPHTATINPGQYKEDIGTTTFKVFCNDNTGYALYAIGYSNEEYGNTNLLPTNTSNPSIATGLATSGDTSNWAMKLTPVTTESSGITQPYVPTIESDTNGSFASYHIVPEEYTKVATFTSTTDFTIGSSLTSTYRVFVQGKQPADTYQGKVKYTLVHPNDANPPEKPKKTAYLDTGPVVSQKVLDFYGYGSYGRTDALPSGFIPSSDNTISTTDSPTPIYLTDEGIYTDAEKVYMNSDSSYLFNFGSEGSGFEEGFLSSLDTSKVTNMSSMFYCSYIYASDIAGWDVSSVTDMSYMFGSGDGCDGSFINGDSNMFINWDVSNVTNMSGMFSADDGGSVIMDSILAGMSGWDTSSVTDMSFMFSGASYLTNIDALSNWNTSSVTNMSYMFYGASSLTDISGAANWNTSNVININEMFRGAYNIDATVLNNWDVSKVTKKSNAFTCPADKRPSWY